VAHVVLTYIVVVSATCVIPIKLDTPPSDELIAYVDALSSLCEVIVVDGSDEQPFAIFAARCGFAVRHVRPHDDFRHLLNGKVAGVLTGVRLASHDRIVIADDDVRYDPATLAAVTAALDEAEVVRPQNYFAPLPWHARLDTARTLLNRVSGGDWPGTLAVRRSWLRRTRGYDGNVMFENLELVRTIVAAGGREAVPLGVYVRRLPSSTGHFLSQRVRQAYDELARPARMVLWLSIVPLLWTIARRRDVIAAAALVSVSIVLAETGRRRAGGRAVFPASASLLAPLWILERAFSAWLALSARIFLGGIPYRRVIVRSAASSMRELRRRHEDLPRQQRVVRG
jgi:hypothetical protein